MMLVSSRDWWRIDKSRRQVCSEFARISSHSGAGLRRAEVASSTLAGAGVILNCAKFQDTAHNLATVAGSCNGQGCPPAVRAPLHEPEERQRPAGLSLATGNINSPARRRRSQVQEHGLSTMATLRANPFPVETGKVGRYRARR